MAKKSQVEKMKRKQKTIAKYAAKRAALKAAGDWAALAELPRDASPTRHKNRCVFTGRAKGYVRYFGISRIQLREMAHKGLLPGVKKASW
ncbi:MULTISPECIES: 30S ribosomal protein S14 [Calidithermus]|jgi:small subunit ribosomal protein S14|uniref:Small ribosomal subunit protein uS14 n=1 Tax=Calidithermus roseus TaxID=1644118 RepID=A0A399EPE0_9DEIN|nr:MULTISPECIES: 30S ribosomal protein S14 [Calidithermus]RIH86584.1 Alternate 30S ribosomal protein S14 [Calidithermus roseus]